MHPLWGCLHAQQNNKANHQGRKERKRKGLSIPLLIVTSGPPASFHFQFSRSPSVFSPPLSQQITFQRFRSFNRSFPFPPTLQQFCGSVCLFVSTSVCQHSGWLNGHRLLHRSVRSDLNQSTDPSACRSGICSSALVNLSLPCRSSLLPPQGHTHTHIDRTLHRPAVSPACLPA